MISENPNSPDPDPPANDAVTRLRLIKLQHSTDATAAAIATLGTLLISRLDRLLEALEGKR